MGVPRVSCELPDREDRIASYVAGRLSAEEAEVFEAHYFACDECWKEIERGLEIRAAVTVDKVGAQLAPPGARATPWRWIAAAATVVLAVAVWRLSPAPTVLSPSVPVTPSEPIIVPQTTPASPVAPIPTPPPARVKPPSPARRGDEPVLRAPAQGLRPTATPESNGDVKIEWPAVERAVRYVVTIFAPDGTEILTRPTTTPAIVIDAALLSARPAGERQFAEVEARSALGVEVAKSIRIDLPVRREEAR